MSQPSIVASGLGKRYQLGETRQPGQTLREAMAVGTRGIVGRLTGHRPRPVAGNQHLWALRDVSLNINQGQTFGIVGRNGAGKTTLLKLLSRITEPTEGSIDIYGRVGSLLEVGTGFHPELTGRENVYLNGAILGMRRQEIRAKFDAIVDFAEIERFIDTPVKRYSSGMYVRLAFAVAAHLEPELLLVDEVLAVGDAAFQKKCLGKMGQIAGQGRTVVFVSHSMPHLESLCEHAIWLERGHLMKMGDTHDVVQAYLSSLNLTSSELSVSLREAMRDPGLIPAIVDGRINGAPIQGQHLISPMSDLDIEVVVELEEPLPDCVMGLHFDTEMGTCIYSSITEWTLSRVDLPGGAHRMLCHVPSFPLVPGTYYVSLWIASFPRLVDSVQRVAKVEVLRQDVYGTGSLPGDSHGFFLSQAEWRIEPVETASEHECAVMAASD